MKQKKLSWMIAGLFTMPAAGVAVAQEAPAAPAAEPAVQQVTVTGIRASMRSALVAKEASNSMIEVVSSEDIGKLPDTTIAESLARLPGMSSGIDRGNASQIVARGLGPRFVGATLNGREIASSEPNRAVRFEQFPSESVSGATVYKTQSAELVEGGIATTIDLQTVRPLSYKERQASLKVDGLYYGLARDIPGSPKVRPRIGAIYVDQTADKKLGWAIAASYNDQPSLVKRVEHWGFNTTNSENVNGKPGADITPWGFAEEAKRGSNKRASALGKVEFKPSNDLLLTGDLYYSKADIKEPGMSHWFENLGNWGGGRTKDYGNVDVRDGYVVGATVKNQGVTTNNTLWVQEMDVGAAGLNAKLNAGAWKLEADLSTSRGSRDSQWRDIRLFSPSTGTFTWSFPGNSVQNYAYTGLDLGNPNNFGASQLYLDTDGHMRDELSGLHLSGARDMDIGPISKLKIGARFTDREKDFHQTTWNLAPTTDIPKGDFETVNVDGLGSFIALRDFMGSTLAAYGPNAYSPAGRTPTNNDLLSGWRVKERSSSIYAQADLDGEVFGTAYRGNVGVRVVRSRQSGEGMQSLDGGAPTAVSGGTSYTEVLPSLNLIFNQDEAGSKQIRFSIARAMSRAPLDEMRASRNISNGGSPDRPLTGSAGNPELKPMMANQVDLSYQWYFKAGSLLQASVFYKQISDYIAIAADKTTLDGRTAELTRSVNGEGGNLRGIELVYQHTFDNGFGIASNYSYTSSDIREQIPVGNPFPVEGLMKDNAGVTVWYAQNGFEARLAANYHSPFVRNPTWSAGALTVNEAETFVSTNLSYQITPKIQIHGGIENLTNQKVTYTTAGQQYRQETFNFGRRYNLGLTFKL